jgi:hypothetical protein
MMMCGGLKEALVSALRENGIKSADQYEEALTAFNAAFGEVVRETVDDLVRNKAKVPLLTQVFNTNEAVDRLPLPWTSESGVGDAPTDTIAATTFYQNTEAVPAESGARTEADANVEGFAFASTSAAAGGVTRYRVCIVTPGGTVTCFEYPPS